MEKEEGPPSKIQPVPPSPNSEPEGLGARINRIWKPVYQVQTQRLLEAFNHTYTWNEFLD